MIQQIESIIGTRKRKHNSLAWRIAYLIDKLEEDPKWYKRILNLTLDRLIDEKYTGGKIALTYEQALQIKGLYESQNT